MKKGFLVVFCIGLFLASCSILSNDTPAELNLVGVWRQDVHYAEPPVEYPAYIRYEFQFEDNSSFQIATYSSYTGTDYSLGTGLKGTYRLTDQSIVIVYLNQQYFPGNQVWGAYSDVGTARVSMKGDQLKITVDYTADGIYDDSYPIENAYPPTNGNPPNDLTFTLSRAIIAPSPAVLALQ